MGNLNIMILFKFIWITSSVCFGLQSALASEINVDLPSSFRLYSTGGGTRVFAGLRSIHASWQPEEQFKSIPLPISLQVTFGDVKIGAIAVSPDGNSIVIGVNGAGGLYRYTKTTSSWDIILPLDASRAVSAITFSPSGDLYIGCGGYFESTLNEARGIFKSMDNGNSWSRLDFNGPGPNVVPGIIDISMSDDGTIAVAAKEVPGSSQSGVYVKIASSKWRLLARVLASRVLVGTSSIYFLTLGIVEVFNKDKFQDSLSRPTPIPNSYGCINIDLLNGDSILVQTRTAKEFDNIIQILKDTVIDPWPVTLPIGDSYEPSVVKCSTKGSMDLIVFGGGANFIIKNGSSERKDLRVDRELPFVTSQIWCRKFSLLYVYRHGWFKIDTFGNVDLLSLEKQKTIVKVNQDVYSIHDDYILSNIGSIIIKITDRDIDTLFTTEPSAYIVQSCSIGDSEYLVATLSNIKRYDNSGQALDTLTLIGWPKYDYNSDSVSLNIGGVFRRNNIIYAWADGNNSPRDYFTKGGLFKYENGEWIRADGNLFGRNSALRGAQSDGNRCLFKGYEVIGGGQSPPPVIGGSMNPLENIVKLNDDLSTIPDIISIALYNDRWLWCTSFGVLWNVDTALYRSSSTTYGRIYQMSWLGQKLLIATETMGVKLIDLSDLATHVESDDQLPALDALYVIPNPSAAGSEVSLLIKECDNLHAYVSTYDVLGNIVSREQLNFSGNVTKYVISKNRGMYLVTVSGHGKCFHSVIVIVE